MGFEDHYHVVYGLDNTEYIDNDLIDFSPIYFAWSFYKSKQHVIHDKNYTHSKPQGNDQLQIAAVPAWVIPACAYAAISAGANVSREVRGWLEHFKKKDEQIQRNIMRRNNEYNCVFGLCDSPISRDELDEWAVNGPIAIPGKGVYYQDYWSCKYKPFNGMGYVRISFVSYFNIDVTMEVSVVDPSWIEPIYDRYNNIASYKLKPGYSRKYLNPDDVYCGKFYCSLRSHEHKWPGYWLP